MTIGAPDTCAITRDLFLRSTADAYQAAVAGVEHMGFTDKGVIGRLAGRTYEGVGSKDPGQVRRILLDLHLRFFGRYLLGRDERVTAPDDPDVTLTVKYAQKGGKTGC